MSGERMFTYLHVYVFSFMKARGRAKDALGPRGSMPWARSPPPKKKCRGQLEVDMSHRTLFMMGIMAATLCPLRDGAMTRLARPHCLPSSKNMDGVKPSFSAAHWNCVCCWCCCLSRAGRTTSTHTHIGGGAATTSGEGANVRTPETASDIVI